MMTSIAAALGAQLTRAEAERAASLKPDDLTSWQAIQRSMRVLTHSFITKAEVDGAIDRLERAVEENPDHIYARAALAWFVVMRIVNLCSADIESDSAKFRDYVAAAATMMGDDPYAMMLVGNALTFSGQARQGKAILERAMELNPGSTDPYPGFALALGILGSYAAAHEALEKARRLAPAGGFAVNFDWIDALVHGFEGKFDEALPTFQRMAAEHPMFPTIHIWLAVAYASSGKTDRIPELIRKAEKAAPTLSLEYLKTVPILHVTQAEHDRRVALIEPYWPHTEAS
jgi:tetratricopeptide (TPR) repeat protein